MFIRPNRRTRNGRTHQYWTLVESFRTARGPRQRVVGYLGDLEEDGRQAVMAAATGNHAVQHSLFDEPGSSPEWIAVDYRRIQVQRARTFGTPWLGLQVIQRLGLDEFLAETLPSGREEISWALMAQILVLGRLCDPSSELSIAEHWYRHSALEDLLGVPTGKVNDDRLYRALDRLLPAKAALEKHLRARMGELFDVEYELLLYDVTSTFFEGTAERNPLARRGYSRDSRPDCKQVCVALIVSRDGMPLGYELFAGNRTDVTTVEEIVTAIESRHGKADRIWVMDRGMVSEENLEFLNAGGRRYILGTAKNQMRRWEAELAGQGWDQVHEGLEVKLCAGPDGQETFILCRSTERREKERAMRDRAAERMELGLQKLSASCGKRAIAVGKVHERIGRLRERYSRASRLHDTRVQEGEAGRATLHWQRRDDWDEWSAQADGCYVLRTNVTDWSGEDLWRAYIQLTEAEAAFRIQKQDLSLRPVWHQTEGRVRAHVLVCFLAYVIWKSLGRMCHAAGLGDCPRRVLNELETIRLVDVVLPLKNGMRLRKRCVTQPEKEQAIGCSSASM